MKSKLVDMMMSFFICTACITILEGIIGRIFFHSLPLGIGPSFHRLFWFFVCTFQHCKLF